MLRQLLTLLVLLGLPTLSVHADRLRLADRKDKVILSQGMVKEGETLKARQVAPLLSVGTRVIVHGKFTGVVRFVGRTAFGDPTIKTWYGIMLDAPMGKNNGSVNGIRYFKAAPWHGLFTLPANVKRLEHTLSSSAISVSHPANDSTAVTFSSKSATTAKPVASFANSGSANPIEGDVAPASTVMRAMTEAAAKAGDSTRASPTAEANGIDPPSISPDTLRPKPMQDGTIPPANPAPLAMPNTQLPSTTDPRTIPFRVESAKDYLSALDSRIQNMRKQHEEASALAHAQEAVLERTAVQPVPHLPILTSQPPITWNGLYSANDPSQLTTDNSQLDVQIEKMQDQLAKLKGQNMPESPRKKT